MEAKKFQNKVLFYHKDKGNLFAKTPPGVKQFYIWLDRKMYNELVGPPLLGLFVISLFLGPLLLITGTASVSLLGVLLIGWACIFGLFVALVIMSENDKHKAKDPLKPLQNSSYYPAQTAYKQLSGLFAPSSLLHEDIELRNIILSLAQKVTALCEERSKIQTSLDRNKDLVKRFSERDLTPDTSNIELLENKIKYINTQLKHAFDQIDQFAESQKDILKAREEQRERERLLLEQQALKQEQKELTELIGNTEFATVSVSEEAEALRAVLEANKALDQRVQV